MFLGFAGNTKLADWYIRNLGVTRNGGYFEYKPMFVEQLPVPALNDQTKETLNQLASTIQKKKEQHEDTVIDEEAVDRIVYEIYGLTAEEINYIERA